VKILDRVEDPGELVEFTVEGRGLWLGIGMMLGAAYFAVYPPIWAHLVRWLSAAFFVAMMASALRNVRWSPLFAGPLLTLSPNEISGRGGLGQAAWHLNWNEVDRVEWGRNGLFVYRTGAASWQRPYRQGGLGGPLLVRALTKRLAAYRALQRGLDPSMPHPLPAT
jgi:hypothetical protein